MIDRSATVSGQQFKQVRAQDIHYSSDEQSGSESEHDSSPRKKIQMKQNQKPLGHGDGGHRRDNAWLQAKHQSILNQPGPKKLNNIWGSVLQEENMSSFVDKLNRNEEVDYNVRGAESYDWTQSKHDPRFLKKDDDEDEESESDVSSGSDDSEDQKDTDVPSDLTNMETFAATTVKGKLDIKQRLGKRVEKKRDSIDSNKSNRSELSNHSCDEFESGEEGMMPVAGVEFNQHDKPSDAREVIKKKIANIGSKSKMAMNPYDKVDFNDLIKQAQDRIKNKKSGPEGMDADDTEAKADGSEPKSDARDKLSTKKSGFDARDRIKNKDHTRSNQTDARDKINSRKRNHHQQKDKNTMHNDKPYFKRRPYAHMDVELKPMKMGVQVSSTMDTLLLADTLMDALQEPQEKLETFSKH